MDLERIKQNLRLRSGRGSKPKKNTRPKAVAQPVANGAPVAPTKPEQQQQHPEPQQPSKNDDDKVDSKSFELGPDLNVDHPPEHRPTLPHAATGLDQDPSENSTRQYGRSGITIKHDKHGSHPLQRTMTDPYAHSSDPDAMDFDLKAPAPKRRPPSIEKLSELLFSAEHLNSILHEPREIARFTAFLSKYKAEYQPLILRYLETQKAIKAIDYANAVAEGATVASNSEDKAVEDGIPAVAATLDQDFKQASTSAFNALVGTALPMYITYGLVKLVTECLIHEVTGKQTPMMRNLVGGLSEVFCITDPNQEDNPIIYASEEFYRLTGYGTEDVIGYNCRFLQGRKTSPESPKRLKESIGKGEEICETILNYRRDGRPFMNLLLLAPLHDNKGKVKYHIGAQVDVTGLIEQGRGVDSFERFLASRRSEPATNTSDADSEDQRKKKALKKLRELSEMFDLEESAVVQTHSRASSMSRGSDNGSTVSTDRRRSNRRVFVDSDESEDEGDQDDEDKGAWNLGSAGPLGLSGRLPGIYDTYMLIRAAPSLRIIFVSPKLRKLGKVIQSPFLAHVAAPATTLKGLKESLTTGTPVSAKLNFLRDAGKSRDGTATGPGYKHEDGKFGKACWISATPLLGSDDKIGVWMIVVVEKTKARNTARVAEVEAKATNKTQNRPTRIDLPPRDTPEQGGDAVPQEEMPIKPKRLDDLGDNEGSGNPSPEQKLSEANSTPQHKTNAISQPQDTDKDRFAIEHTDSSIPNSAQHADEANGLDNTPNHEAAEDWHPTRSRSNTQDSPEEDRKYTPPPVIPDSMIGATPPPRTPGEAQHKLEHANASPGSDENAHEFDLTPTRVRSHDEDETPTRPIARNETEFQKDDGDDQDDAENHYSGADGMKQSNLMNMDYLRHPGSQPVPGRHQKLVRDEDKWTDIDCMRSPFSVD